MTYISYFTNVFTQLCSVRSYCSFGLKSLCLTCRQRRSAAVFCSDEVFVKLPPWWKQFTSAGHQGIVFTSFVGECDKQSEIASTDFHWPSQLTSSWAPSANLNGNTYIYFLYFPNDVGPNGSNSDVRWVISQGLRCSFTDCFWASGPSRDNVKTRFGHQESWLQSLCFSSPSLRTGGSSHWSPHNCDEQHRQSQVERSPERQRSAAGIQGTASSRLQSSKELLSLLLSGNTWHKTLSRSTFGSRMFSFNIR